MLPNFNLMAENIICLDKHIQGQLHSLCSHSRVSHPTLPTNQAAVKGIMRSHTLRSHSRNFPKEANTTVRVNYVDAVMQPWAIHTGTCKHIQHTHTHCMHTLPWTNPNPNLPHSLSAHICTHIHTHSHTVIHTHTHTHTYTHIVVMQPSSWLYNIVAYGQEVLFRICLQARLG